MRREGIALVATLAVVVVIAVLVFGTFFTTQLEIWTTRNDVTANQAYAVAQAGIQKYKTLAFQTFRYYLNNINTYGSELARYAQCGNLLTIGLDLDRNGTIAAGTDLPNGGTLTETILFPDGSRGTYTVSLSVSGSYLTLRSVGQYGGAQATVTAVARVSSKGIFSNAIATGLGVGTLNGNLEIWGSVYAQATNPSDFVIGSSGAFKMHNYYTATQLAQLFGNNFTVDQIRNFLKLQAMEQRDMCATLSVTGGKVKIWGNSQIGDASLPQGLSASDGWNPKVDGIYVGSGTQGTRENECNNVSNAPDVCVGGGANLYTSGGIGAFPYTNPPAIPSLSGPCTNAGQTWRECLRNLAATQGVVLEKGASSIPSGLVCDLSTILSGNTLTFGQTPITCLEGTPPNAKGFIYTYDAITRQGTLTVYGTVNFRGYDLKFEEDVVVRYTNKATLFVEAKQNQGGNITLEGNLLPGQSFPDRDVLGLIAENTLTITGDTQNLPGSSPRKQVVMGLFYAGQRAIIQQNSTVFGTVVAREVCTSNNCNAGSGNTSIVQVPGLEFNLPPGFNLAPNTTSAFFGQLTYERR
ncbi:hypothetical protein [Thermus tengchongensis]|uniref:hypothetical protein n=1 Tax=Thermus tengchongensis TaxID=1214928 RepID=UPI001F2B757C|nr:hypothetical protein [Thermus tengchongensis]